MKRKGMRVALVALAMLLLVMPIFSAVSAADAAEEELEEKILEACRYGTTVNLAHFGISYPQLKETFLRLDREGRLPWYTDRTYTYTKDAISGNVDSFTPLLLDKSYDRMAYAQRVAEILEEVPLEGMEDWQIALVLHDWLALHCVYDESLQKSTGYDLLINGSTVCAGYAELYQELLLAMGIPCVQVESQDMDHAWNLVCIGGKWYHVDVTWDDPTPDISGRVSHAHFLRTDEEMKTAEKPYYGWESDIVCDDTRFSEAFWREVTSPIVFTDAETCFYLREKDLRNSLYRRNTVKDKETRIYQEKDSYVNLGAGSYRYSHTGLFLRDGRLWLCSMDKVISMKLDGKGQKTEHTHNAKKEKQYLSACFAVEDVLYLTLTTHDGESTQQTFRLPESDAHRHSYTLTVTEPKCGKGGYTEAVCECGIHAVGDLAAPLEHQWVDREVVEATQDAPGYREICCEDCGATERIEIPVLGKEEVLKKKVPLVAIACGGVLFVLLIAAVSPKKKR